VKWGVWGSKKAVEAGGSFKKRLKRAQAPSGEVEAEEATDKY